MIEGGLGRGSIGGTGPARSGECGDALRGDFANAVVPGISDVNVPLAIQCKAAGTIEAGLGARSATEWEALLNAAGVPAGQVLSVPQILAHEQVRGREFVIEIEPVPGLGKAAHVSRGGFMVNGAAVRPAAPPPALGAQTETWLRKLGYDDAHIARLRIEKAI